MGVDCCLLVDPAVVRPPTSFLIKSHTIEAAVQHTKEQSRQGDRREWARHKVITARGAWGGKQRDRQKYSSACRTSSTLSRRG